MARREAPAAVLASRWSAPNPPDIAVGQPLVCVATTLGLHATLLEGDLLPRFLGLRFDGNEGERAFILEREQRLAEVPVFVLVNADHVDPRQSTLRWSQLPVRIPTGFQHAKVALLLWERAARVIVSSANLTRPGYRQRREIAGVLDFFDASSSVPRSVAMEVIGFLQVLTDFAVAPDAALRRLRDSLDLARKRIGRWTRARASFGAREVPRVHFVAGYPASAGGAKRRSVMDQLLRLWGAHATSDVRVVTPFVGDVDSGPNPVALRLATIRNAIWVRLGLAAPGHKLEGEERTTIDLPFAFWRGWHQAWKRDLGETHVYVPKQRPGEKITRDLHAKAIYLEASKDDRALLLAGSSNFSLHGMGVNVKHPNAEANLVYIDRAASGLRDRTPIVWDEDRVGRHRWAKPTELDAEDDLAVAELPPPVFRWATHDQLRGIVTVGLAPEMELPRGWSIVLDGIAKPLASHAARTAPTEESTLVLGPREELRKQAIGLLRVVWADDEGEKHSAPLLVQASAPEDLLPPEEHGALNADRIIEALLSGREAAEVADGEEARGGATRVGTIDSHDAVDTSSWALYRVRRLGRALAELAERIQRTTRSREATGYRLRQDPLGPVQLARALVREWLPGGKGGTELDLVVFGLAEVALTVVRAGSELKRAREKGEPDLRPLFRGVAREIVDMCSNHLPVHKASPVMRYVREVRRAARRQLR